MKKTYDLNIVSATPLIAPETLKAEAPLDERNYEVIVESRETIKRIISGRDDRLLAIVGPCSIHDPAVALDYAGRLRRLRAEIGDRIYLVMRVYFEKPRTALGWRGFIVDPRLDGSDDIAAGLRLARRLLVDITAMGVPAASEMLDPIVPQYIDDLISWAAIGARTTESQTHREMASGLSVPVGFKNGTNGDYDAAINALKSCRSSHSFIGIDQKGSTCVLKTAGNPYAHIISRGGTKGPNYSAESIRAVAARLEGDGIRPAILIDCSHGNSGKQYLRQAEVLQEVVALRASPNAAVIGFMLESNIEEGRQDVPEDLGRLRYGVSITDACLGWPATEAALRSAHRALERGKT